MPKIILVRHGQDTDNAAGILNGRRDTELTALGRQQARETADRLKGEKIDLIYHSPLKRTTQTAQIIADELAIKTITSHDDLIEREFGDMTGKEVADIKKLENVIETEHVTYFLDVPNSENLEALLRRGKKC